MAKKPSSGADAAPGTQERTPKKVRITHYKVFTSIGRLIEGRQEYLPAPEADDLIAKGHAVECPS